MTRSDWWIGIGIVTAALILHAAFPRYEWRGDRIPVVRIDRWTGEAIVGRYIDSARGRVWSPQIGQFRLEDIDPQPDTPQR